LRLLAIQVGYEGSSRARGRRSCSLARREGGVGEVQDRRRRLATRAVAGRGARLARLGQTAFPPRLGEPVSRRSRGPRRAFGEDDFLGLCRCLDQLTARRADPWFGARPMELASTHDHPIQEHAHAYRVRSYGRMPAEPPGNLRQRVARRLLDRLPCGASGDQYARGRPGMRRRPRRRVQSARTSE
jgi:hypothetical protein